MPPGHFQHTLNAQAPFIGLPGKKIKVDTHDAPSSSQQEDWPLSSQEQPPNQRNANNVQPTTSTGMKLDTNVSRHQGHAPKQLFPRLDIPDFNPTGKSNSKRMRGSRPPRLDLTKELSPFDRDISIALSVPLSTKSSKHGGTPNKTGDELNRGGQSFDQPQTPRIVVTPIRDTPQLSPSQLKQRRKPNPASSVYTRAASTVGKSGPSQDVPPLPRELKASQHRSWTSATPRTALSDYSRSTQCPVSPWWTYRDDELSSAHSAPGPYVTPSKSPVRRSTILSVLPTPRRSRGWWNLLMSPVPGKESISPMSRSKSFPLVDDDAPEVPILEKAEPMATSKPRGLDCGVVDGTSAKLATGSAHPHASFDLTTPTTGEAAKYYDLNNHYPEEEEKVVPPASKEVEPLQGIARQPAVTAKSPDDNNLHGDDDEDEAGPVETKETAKQPTLKLSPTTPKKIRSVHGLLGEGPSEYHDPESRVVVNNPSRFHEVMSPQAATGEDKAPEPKTETTNAATDRQAQHATRSPTQASEALSPVVGLATVKQFQSARTVDAKSPKDRTVEPAPTDWPIRTDSAQHHQPLTYEAESSEKHERRRSDTRPIQLFPAYRPFPSHEKSEVFRPLTQSEKERKKERNFLILIATTLIMILVLILILCMTVVRTHHDMPVEAQWINLANLPPLPTGISTFVGPRTTFQSGCSSDPNLWSCSAPKEQQSSAAPGSDLPRFRIEIRSRQSPPSNSTSNQRRVKRTVDGGRSTTALASTSVQAAALVARDIFTGLITTPDPAPPSTPDYTFLGNTTDNVALPFDGEKTPFTISFLPFASPNATQASKRDTNSSNSSPVNLPRPEIDANGTASPAQLYPLPSAQPLKLFDRGKQTEHYGFYTYFDKSIFMRYPPSNSSTLAPTYDPANDRGGIPRDQANVRCTWSQTRFLVQIWTKGDPSSIIGPTNSSASSPNATSSALDSTPPGSFTLPITIKIDRHGGDPAKKGLYCDALGNQSKPQGQAVEVDEDRGTLVNPAAGPFTAGKGAAEKFGGYDGGSGGCWCDYTNYSA